MIEARDIFKSFGPHRVLDGISFEVHRGESVVIIGGSGGGKSILLKNLIGLLQPDSGDVRIEGQSITDLNERELLRVRRKFGMLFQSAALFDSLSVGENVAFLLRRERRHSETEITRRVAETLRLVDLGGTEEKMPSELSGGMRKRVGLARAIIHEPEIVLYDEPTTGLDPIIADSIDRLILRVCEQLHCTTVVVTHDMRSARRLGQRVLMLYQGKIRIDGTPEDVFNSTDPVVHQFVNGISNA